MKKLAVVILNWNGEALLRQFLPTTLAHSPQGSVYVIDNASTDASVEVLKTEFPQVTLIQNEANFGYAKGYNEGLKQIDAEILCLLNSDIEVTEGWLEEVMQVFTEKEHIAAIQPKILDFKRKTHFEYAGAAGGFIDKYGFPFCRGRIFHQVEEDKNQYLSEEIFWASGACLFVRKSVFDQLKGFDDDFFAHQEEIDLCWGIHHLGKKVYFCSNSVVYHIGGATLSASNPQKMYLNFRNGLYLLLKNLPGEVLFHRIFMRMLWDGIAGVHFLWQGKPKFTWAIVRAHFSFYRNFFHFYRKREKTISDYHLVKSIVFLFFIKNKNLFSDLKKFS